MSDKKDISIKKINKKKDYLISKQLMGRRLVYVFEPVEEITLELKKNLMFAGFLPYNYKDRDEMVRDSHKRPPEVFIISTMDKKNYEIITQIKSDPKLSNIFVVSTSIFKSSEEESMDAGADFYIPMPYVWKKLPPLVRALTFINDIRQSDGNSLEEEGISINFSGKDDTLIEIIF